MPFPISLDGTVAARDVSVEAAIAGLEVALSREKARELRREGGTLRFRGAPFRAVSSWNFLLPISDGVLEISAEGDGVRVSWRVTFERLLVWVTVPLLAIFGPSILLTRDLTVAGGLGVLAAMWLWLFGVNYVLTWLRLPSFVARTLSRAKG